jgi:UDP-N-acetylmuramyl pentapeptide phosphotransferase/UDP-N-acetylglucosamine-1-phosphate transferase
MNLLLSLILAVAISLLGMRAFRKLNILDKPGNDLKNTRKPVPTILGIFVYFGFFGIVALLFPEYLGNNLFWGLMV